MKQTIIGAIISAIVAVAIVLSIVDLPHKVPVTPALGGTEVRAPNVDTVTYNGVQTTYRRNGDTLTNKGNGALTQASTTICAIQSPVSTSTLQAANIKLDTSSSTASVITIAKASTAFATTTTIGSQYTVSANAQAFIQASTSPAAGAVTVFGPNQWLVVGMQGGTGTFSSVGSCAAEWISSAPNV